MIARLEAATADNRAAIIAEASGLRNRLAHDGGTLGESGRLSVALSWAHRQAAEYPEAETAARLAIEAGQRTGDLRLEADGHNALGGVFWRRSEYAGVWTAWTTALRLREETGDESGTAASLSNLGIILDDQGDFPGALEYYSRALEIDRRIGSEPLSIAATINNIAGVHAALRNPEVALRHHREALEIRRRSGDSRSIAVSQNNIGEVLVQLGQMQAAREALGESLQIRRAINDRQGEASSLRELGALAMAEGDLRRADELVRQSLLIREELAESWGVADSAILLGEIALESAQPESALVWFTRAEQEARGIDARKHLIDLLAGRARAWAALGEGETAFRVQNEQIALREEVMGEQARRRIELLELRHETQRRELELARLRESQERTEAELRETAMQSRAIGWGLAGLSVFAACLGLALRAQRRAARRLQQLSFEKDHFLRVVAHDLRSPLGNIRWLSGLLQQAQDIPTEVRKTSQMIDRTAERLIETTTNLLDINRIEEGAVDVKFTEFDLLPGLTEVIAQHEPSAQAKDQTIEWSRDPASTIPVWADPGLVQQILDNLVSNAVKFSPPGGRIRVSVATESGTVRVEVADNGPGISAEARGGLFKKFATVGNSPTGGEDSHGLGLAISHGLANLMGGALELMENTPHGMGARFRLSLPRPDDSTGTVAIKD